MTDTLKLSNSIWNNGMQVDSDGYAVFYPLGTNKSTIPTSVSEWPEGTKIVSPFVYDENDILVGFCDTKAMTANSGATITMPYEHIEADFSSIKEGTITVNAPNATVKKFIWADSISGGDNNVIVTLKYKGCKTVADVKAVDPDYLTNDIVDGVWSEGLGDLEQGGTGGFKGGMFYRRTALTAFISDLSSLTNGEGMFSACDKLTTFSSELPSLTNGNGMFYSCDKLTTFSSELPSLTNGRSMFEDCYKLTTFSSDLSSLTDGRKMFYGCLLTSFSSDLSSLTDGDSMFYCCPLTSFSSNLSSLTNGEYMFWKCTNLTSFSSDLSSLTNGKNMFRSCSLDAPSVKNIIETINTYSASLTLGMGCNDTEADKNLFAQEAGYTDMASLLAALQAKGWTVEAQYNGRPTSTYSLRRPSEDTLPVFVKLEEVEDHATHSLEDGSKKFRLNYFHETTGSTDGYTQFNSLEEAIESLNIKPIERN